jgi:hypothetical protein
MISSVAEWPTLRILCQKLEVVIIAVAARRKIALTSSSQTSLFMSLAVIGSE